MATATSGLSLHSSETACLNRNFVLATVSGLIVLFAMMSAMSHLPTYSQLAHGMDPTAVASGYGKREYYVFSAWHQGSCVSGFDSADKMHENTDERF